MPKPPKLHQISLFIDDDLDRFLSAASNKLRQTGQPGMSKDRLASILVYIGAAGQMYKEGAEDMGDELVARANALADGYKLPVA